MDSYSRFRNYCLFFVIINVIFMIYIFFGVGMRNVNNAKICTARRFLHSPYIFDSTSFNVVFSAQLQVKEDLEM